MSIELAIRFLSALENGDREDALEAWKEIKEIPDLKNELRLPYVLSGIGAPK